MKKNKVVICTGTACFVMGGSELLLLEEQLPEDLRGITEIEGAPCQGLCKLPEYGKAQADYAPFVRVNGEVMAQATARKIIDCLRGSPDQSGGHDAQPEQ